MGGAYAPRRQPFESLNDMQIPAPLRVVLVGYGYAGRTFHAPLIQATPGLDLACVVSSDPAKVAADLPGVAVAPTLAAALADTALDLVVIATPDRLHAEGARQALEAGRSVVVDKPFTYRLGEARALEALERTAPGRLFVFHNRRFDSDFLTLRRLMDEGALGRVCTFESRFDRFRPVVRDRWREAAGGGVMNDLSPHLIDQALVLFGAPKTVFAETATLREGGQADDYFQLLLGYDRLRVTLSASMVAPAAALRFRVDGDRGAYLKSGLDAQEDQLKSGLSPLDADFGLDPHPGLLIEGESGVAAPAPPERGAYLAYYAQVRAALATGEKGPCSAAEAVQVMEILALARQSARTGVKLDYHPGAVQD